MTVTIRCSCGNRFTIEDEQPATEPANDPGDITTQPHHPAWTDTGLGFTTPALGSDA